jgi:hypothetical protein
LLSLADSFKAVEEQTTEFRAQCEEILADQKKTSKLADDITENLQYYNYLEPITKRLNAPGAGNLIRRAEFSDMLANIDTCLDYMQAHVSHHMVCLMLLTNPAAKTARGISLRGQIPSTPHARSHPDQELLHQLAP